jgi:hypothetical protein
MWTVEEAYFHGICLHFRMPDTILNVSRASETWKSIAVITSPKSVDLLTNRSALPVLEVFLQSEHTLSSAAKQLNRTPSSVAYWIPKLLKAGLIQQIDAIERAGMAMPVYRAIAKEFRVRYALLPVDRRIALFDGARMELLRLYLDGIDEAMQRHSACSVAFSAPKERRLTIQAVFDDAREPRPFAEQWFVLKLSPEDAVEFKERLHALTAEFDSRGGKKTFVGHIGFVAKPKVRWRSANDPALD